MSFESWRSYWKFHTAVTGSSRYIFDAETQLFLDEVLRTCESRVRAVTKEFVFWRAQLGSGTRPIYDDEGDEAGEQPCPHPPSRMKPLQYAATEGRANPKGIPYLYLATSKETAMSEVRPWIGSEISVARFATKKDVTIVDCSLNHSLNPLYFSLERGFYEPSAEEKEQAVWAHIDRAFSQPIVQNESKAHYVPTQIIAELFKKNGFDGLAYQSSLGHGFNIALFDPDATEMLNCSLYEVTAIDFRFTECADPYVLHKESET